VATLAILYGLGAAQHPDAGTDVFPFLRINYDAREGGLAGAMIGFPAHAGGASANPAILGYIGKKQAVVGYRHMILDVWGGMASYSMPIASTGTWSVNILDFSAGTVEEVIEENGLPVETGVTWRDNAVSGGLSWGRIVWEQLALGASLRGVHHTIGSSATSYSASAVTADLGVQYRLFKDRFVAGIAVRNLGFLTSSYGADVKYALPVTLGAGMSYSPRYVDNMRIGLDLEKPVRDGLQIEPGLEISVFQKILLLRLGYPFSDRDVEEAFNVFRGTPTEGYQKSFWRTLCLGIGLQTATGTVDLNIDAAIEFHTDVNPSPLLTVSVGF